MVKQRCLRNIAVVLGWPNEQTTTSKPQYWCSCHSTGMLPLICRLILSHLKSGRFSGWKGTHCSQKLSMVFNLLNEWEPMGPRGSVREEGMNCAHKFYEPQDLIVKTSTQNHKVSAILVFGDSTSDPGNNNYIPTHFRGNFTSYGRDFANQKATTRCTNGKKHNPNFRIFW
ncbi:unnamed protein product [Lactuca saligna]|uniref:GDSL esterase/lipase n=1 Tax=Lactuca saligna TaxID=75948 RepID=A0AA36EBT3_LACSI|nr:unnamed protein product [Lactuca saligna]